MLEAERFLAERGIPYRLINLTDRAMTVADVLRFSKGDFPEEVARPSSCETQREGATPSS
jgi:hypothetical protein